MMKVSLLIAAGVMGYLLYPWVGLSHAHAKQDCYEDCIEYGGTCIDYCHTVSGSCPYRQKTGEDYDLCFSWPEETGKNCDDSVWPCYVRRYYDSQCEDICGNPGYESRYDYCTGLSDC